MYFNLGFKNPLRTVNNTTKDDGVLVSVKTPTDCNVGKPNSFRESLSAVIGSMHQSKSKAKAKLQRTASSELLKINGLENYTQACAEYHQALEAGWSKQQLLELVEEWQKMDERACWR
ncbi:hypothetical protein GMOD_00009862 [Pyrenophora seminiperda CCB06]|uniref:Uncharacterized protein n=1 Tax=Pyrenophora seminiperda CCB06 TaxID=1302712 RepID=A0A3M7ME68_9PLEO|nr:hypothetical protein GMOD_00009862 [Pyrenophora seminiperda CCB06]